MKIKSKDASSSTKDQSKIIIESAPDKKTGGRSECNWRRFSWSLFFSPASAQHYFLWDRALRSILAAKALPLTIMVDNAKQTGRNKVIVYSAEH